MNKISLLLKQICKFLLVPALLLSGNIAHIPVAAEEASDIEVKIFQSTSHYDMGIDHENVRLG